MAATAELQKIAEFAVTPRGRYLVGQALYYAIQELEKVDPPHREVSNIADMRLLQKVYFPYELVAQAVQEMGSKHGG